MEPVIFFTLVSVVSIGSFWIAGMVYGLICRPPIYFPVSLAAKMALCAVFGSLMFMIGGVILSTLVFNAEISKRPDYEKWPNIIAGLIISIVCMAIIYFSAFALAWAIFD